MKIIYLTTAMDENDFALFSKCWTVPLNPSNQNFHSKLIRALASNNEVSVISFRPFSNKNCSLKRLDYEEKQDGNISWFYLKVIGNKIFKRFVFKKQVKKLAKKLITSESIILTDTINPNVSTFAKYLNKKFRTTTVGICTDSPSNISFTSKSYSLYILRTSENFDGYIALTKELNEHFNKNKKPSLINEGVIEERLPQEIENIYGDYFFFGGALMERYGVYSLIEAFNSLERKDVKLLICGHHANEQMLKKAISTNKNIVYLGILPVKEVLQLEMNALCCINPRPYSQDLDRFSIPSKTIEYISTGKPTISVKNSILQERFPDSLIWSESSEAENLKKAMEKVLSMGITERQRMGAQAKANALREYSLTAVNGKICSFLKELKK